MRQCPTAGDADGHEKKDRQKDSIKSNKIKSITNCVNKIKTYSSRKKATSLTCIAIVNRGECHVSHMLTDDL